MKLIVGIAVAIASAVAVAAIGWSGPGRTVGPPSSPSISDRPPPSPSTNDRPPDGTPDSPSDPPKNADEVTAALTRCSEQAAAAETAIAAADTGIGHWGEHVQAQTDRLEGRISRSEMGAIFKRTKTAGPADDEAWDEAAAAWEPDPDACRPITGAADHLAAAMKVCATRLTALEQAMPAAVDGMKDWTDHLADMRKSAEGHVGDPMQAWMETWEAAPPNIKRWKSAKQELADVPQCAA